MAEGDERHRHILSFYQALGARDWPRLETYLEGDVDWIMFGPVDVLPDCGVRHGKAAVISMFRDAQRHIATAEFRPDFLVVDGDRAAAFLRQTGFLKGTGRKVVLRVAHFMRLRGHAIAQFRGIVDSLDAAAQVMDTWVDMRAR
jgi:ketosteroid isomerase-like protein